MFFTRLFWADLSIILDCKVYSKERKKDGKKKERKIKCYVLFQVVKLQIALNCGATRWSCTWERGWGNQVKAGHQKCPTKVSTIPRLAAFKADFQGLWTSSNPVDTNLSKAEMEMIIMWRLRDSAEVPAWNSTTEITIGVITLTFKLSKQKMLKICSNMLYLWLTRGKGDESTGNIPLMFELHTQVSCLDFWGFFYLLIVLW